MKFFVLTVLRMYYELEKIGEKIDKSIISAATSVKSDAEELCLFLMDLNDNKRILANMKVMRDKIADELGNNGFEMLESYAFGVSAEEIAAGQGVCRSTALRRINREINAAVSVLETLGINIEKVENEYFSLPVVKRVYDFYAVKKAPRKSGIERSDNAAPVKPSIALYA